MKEMENCISTYSELVTNTVQCELLCKASIVRRSEWRDLRKQCLYK